MLYALGPFGSVIEEEASAELQQRQPTSLEAKVPNQVVLSPNQQRTAYYLSGIILERARRHFSIRARTDGYVVADALVFLACNNIGGIAAGQEDLPCELVVERQRLPLVFVSKNFMQWVVFLEATIGLNFCSANFAEHREGLIDKLEDMAFKDPAHFSLFQKAAPRLPLSVEMDQAEREPQDVGREIHENLRPLFYFLFRKYLKLWRADFIKARLRHDREERKAMRRHLELITGTISPGEYHASKRSAATHGEKLKEAAPENAHKHLSSVQVSSTMLEEDAAQEISALMLLPHDGVGDDFADDTECDSDESQCDADY